ncbi:keratin, type II cytoskeletal I-like isoform X2 [Mercenaria mercenaria]|uniref:keratin, type II cytoskeletal I-like isoform X2 n=1 Tax=Mercenaria mercenaria TaxID=6596 RepID=UPI00234FAD7D|nr:keratin, type II cytoskeletal I-like isoform X2 [Mercenaria mercenaria]
MNVFVVVAFIASVCVVVNGQGASGNNNNAGSRPAGTPNNNAYGNMGSMMRMMASGGAAPGMRGGGSGGGGGYGGGQGGGMGIPAMSGMPGGMPGGPMGAMMFGGMDANNIFPFMTCMRFMPPIYCLSQYIN